MEHRGSRSSQKFWLMCQNRRQMKIWSYKPHWTISVQWNSHERALRPSQIFQMLIILQAIGRLCCRGTDIPQIRNAWSLSFPCLNGWLSRFYWSNQDGLSLNGSSSSFIIFISRFHVHIFDIIIWKPCQIFRGFIFCRLPLQLADYFDRPVYDKTQHIFYCKERSEKRFTKVLRLIFSLFTWPKFWN